MGRRKASKKIVKKVKAKVDTTFSCPFCNHSGTVECKM
jgi:transcription elongation factor Elf1